MKLSNKKYDRIKKDDFLNFFQSLICNVESILILKKKQKYLKKLIFENIRITHKKKSSKIFFKPH